MAKIVAIGDIHGDNRWKDIVNQEQDADRILIIGDYFDSFVYNTEQQCNNFLDLIAFKKANLDKVVLLIANHDCGYLPDFGQMSGYQPIGRFQIEPVLKDNLEYLQVAHQEGKLLFTHAGVSEVFLNHVGIQVYEGVNLAQELNELFKYKPLVFDFYGTDPYGDNIEQTPIWIRPRSLMRASQNLKKAGYIQIFGHTPQKQIDIKGKATGKKYFNIDTLNTNGEYLVIENGQFYSRKIT